jgi:hypothetical protein
VTISTAQKKTGEVVCIRRFGGRPGGRIEILPFNTEISVATFGLSVRELTVHHDHDTAWFGPASGAGEIYIDYGLQGNYSQAHGETATHDINAGETHSYVGENTTLTVSAESYLSLSFDVWDRDWWPDANDHLNGTYTATFHTGDNFGVGTHTVDMPHYQLVYEIFMA